MSTVMTTEDRRTERGQTDIEEHRKMNRYFVEKYGFGMNFLRREIAKKCIDLSGTLSKRTTLVVRLFKGDKNFLMDLHRDGTDGLTDQDRFWFEFPIRSISEFPFYPYLGEEKDGVYEIIGDGDLIDHMSVSEVLEEAVECLLFFEHKGFMDRLHEFETRFYRWSMEMD